MDRKISTQSAMHLDTPSTCQLLAEAFCNFGTLTGICLEAVVVLNPERQCSPEQAEYLDWRDMWQGTLKLFRILISAISQSQIRVESLQIFKETNICSIPINELAAIKDGRFEKVASHLQKLSISLSPIPKTPITLRRLDTSRSRNDSAEIVSFDDVKRLLQIMPKLETLYLHFFQVSPTKTSELRAPCHDMLEMIMMDTKMVFPLLKDVSLKCLPITTPAIGHLLARCPQLHSLSLEYVELLGNRWGEALAPIISSSVANLNLSNLYSCFILETPRPVGIITNRGRGDVTIRAAQALHAKKPQSTQLKYRDRDVEKEESLGPNDRRRGVMIEIGSESLIEGGFASPERKLRAMRLRLLCGPPPGL
jgi:hypothetical protein